MLGSRGVTAPPGGAGVTTEAARIQIERVLAERGVLALPPAPGGDVCLHCTRVIGPAARWNEGPHF